MLGLVWAGTLSYSAVKLFSKYSNLCDYGTWTSRTDCRLRRTVRRHCNITALCVASRNKIPKRSLFLSQPKHDCRPRIVSLIKRRLAVQRNHATFLTCSGKQTYLYSVILSYVRGRHQPEDKNILNLHSPDGDSIISYHHIIWICYGAPIRSSEAPYKVKYRLNNTTNRWYDYKIKCISSSP